MCEKCSEQKINESVKPKENNTAKARVEKHLEKHRLLREKKFRNKKLLKQYIGEAIKNQLTEQTATQCSDIINQAYGGQGYFFSCCENGYYPNPPQGMSDPACKQYVDYGAITYGLTPNEVANCCDPNWGTGDDPGDDPCQDPNWINMPDGATMGNPGYSFFKNDYCDRCNAAGGAATQNVPVVWNNPSVPPGGWYYDPINGTNYCQCCDNGHSSGDLDCGNPEWVAQNPGIARKCYICREAPFPCQQIGNTPGMSVAIAQQLGLTLYNDLATCNASTECGPVPVGDMVYCECCSGDLYGQAQSMAQQVPANIGCIGAENTFYAGLNVHSCALSPVSGGPGTGKACGKKPPVDTGEMPMDDMEPMPMIRPKPTMNPDRKMRRENKIKSLIKSILKEIMNEEEGCPPGTVGVPPNCVYVYSPEPIKGAGDDEGMETEGCPPGTVGVPPNCVYVYSPEPIKGAGGMVADTNNKPKKPNYLKDKYVASITQQKYKGKPTR